MTPKDALWPHTHRYMYTREHHEHTCACTCINTQEYPTIPTTAVYPFVSLIVSQIRLDDFVLPCCI